LHATAPDWNEVLPQLMQATKEIDRQFLARVGGSRSKS
jgi:hypothetical protein